MRHLRDGDGSGRTRQTHPGNWLPLRRKRCLNIRFLVFNLPKGRVTAYELPRFQSGMYSMNQRFTAICISSFVATLLCTPAGWADDVAPQPINLIINPKGNTGLGDPNPQIIGHAGSYMLFT